MVTLTISNIFFKNLNVIWRSSAILYTTKLSLEKSDSNVTLPGSSINVVKCGTMKNAENYQWQMSQKITAGDCSSTVVFFYIKVVKVQHLCIWQNKSYCCNYFLFQKVETSTSPFYFDLKGTKYKRVHKQLSTF